MSASASGKRARGAVRHCDAVRLLGIRHAGQAWIEGDGRLEAEFARNIAELEDACDLATDRLEELVALCGGVGHAVEFFGLGPAFPR